MKKRSNVWLGTLLALAFIVLTPLLGVTTINQVSASRGSTQSDTQYANSYAATGVTNVVATTQKVSCYRPEVYLATAIYPDGGMEGCNGRANTGENIGTSPYATQAGSNQGYPASGPMLVKDHSESDIRVDTTNPNHLIASSKWFVSAEGYNHLLGFYESFDGGQTWPVQGHIPGYEGWTDDTDPVGAFDGYGNYYELNLPYQFFYNNDGSHNYSVGGSHEPNPTIPAEVISVSVRPHGATQSSQWLTTHNGQPDYIATYDSKGREPDKQWITIDSNPNSPNYNTIYAMWVLFTGSDSAKPFVSTARALPDGTHTDWSTPLLLPTVNGTSSDTYLLPHVDPSGVIYTTEANFPSGHQFCCANISVISSTDAGQTWQGPQPVPGAQNIIQPPYIYANTTFRSGILETFGVGNRLSAQGHYPLYVSWEEASTGVSNIMLSASYDGGSTWTPPSQVNDNVSAVDELQPNLTVLPNGTVAVAFYDRRLTCPAAGTPEAQGAGLAQDPTQPYGVSNYCLNTSVQFYSPTLTARGHNVRLSAHTWDPQLNSPQVSCPSCGLSFIGDYFGIAGNGAYAFTTSVSTYNYGSNPSFHQQQVVARINAP